ncbi:hypothetical protein BC938DRAFT_482828 [Jimgerdemannia flammicorona]|uniref:F-box domain-containing protein n=1 Tax=Jimgerdemannia flammicorona TaxID=994334 RepID=A0A433QW24_9FUNG|nr:hypothetical protein BC938DRAFT_482828 [Jimgerdemannia flammicorona]
MASLLLFFFATMADRTTDNPAITTKFRATKKRKHIPDSSPANHTSAPKRQRRTPFQVHLQQGSSLGTRPAPTTVSISGIARPAPITTANILGIARPAPTTISILGIVRPVPTTVSIKAALCEFSSLPDDVLSYIAQYLSFHELWRLSQVSTACRDVCYQALSSLFDLNMRCLEGGADAVELLLSLRGALVTFIEKLDAKILQIIVDNVCGGVAGCGSDTPSSRFIRDRVKITVDFVFTFATLPITIHRQEYLATLLLLLQQRCSSLAPDACGVHVPDLLHRSISRFLNDMDPRLNPVPPPPSSRSTRSRRPALRPLTTSGRLRLLKRLESSFTFLSHAQNTTPSTGPPLLATAHLTAFTRTALVTILRDTAQPHVLPAKVRILESLHDGFRANLQTPPAFQSVAARRAWVAALVCSRQFYAFITAELARALAAQAFKMFELILRHQELVRQSLWQFPQFKDWARIMLERLRKQVTNGIRTQAYGHTELQLVEQYRSFWATLIDEPPAGSNARGEGTAGRWTEDQMRAEGRMLLDGVKGYV